ncbi:MAG: shikimate kinase [candidate division Zixibacteria bacterium]|nr:shikimate kinase [candidate division Zixibacteria bacterium]
MATAPTVFLCGFSGAGKSESGRILARRLDREFIDTDELVAERLQLSIPEIFAVEGEERFRRAEREVICSVAAVPPAVVALGAGAIADDENLEQIKRCGLLVYLRVTPETARRRLQGSHSRPKLGFSPEVRVEAIEALMRQREPYYRQAGYMVDTEGMTPDEVATEIARVVYADERRIVDNRRL